jgi:hypothetical protein
VLPRRCKRDLKSIYQEDQCVYQSGSKRPDDIPYKPGFGWGFLFSGLALNFHSGFLLPIQDICNMAKLCYSLNIR